MIIRYAMICAFIILSICISYDSYATDYSYGSGADTGEAASGNYGEMSVTYSSSSPGDYGSWTGTTGKPYSFTTYPPNSQTTKNTNAGQTAYTPTSQPQANAAGSSAPLTFSAPPESEKRTLQSYNLLNGAPKAVLYNNLMLPWSTFVASFPKNVPMLWINTNDGWQWYSTCPLGSWLQQLMFIPNAGKLRLYETYPDKTVRYYDYGYATSGYHYIWFNGDTAGRHSQFITVDDMPSNAVDLDVF